MPAGRVLLFWSIIMYHRSIMFYLDGHVIFSLLYTIWTVDHNWPTVDHDLPCSCTTSQSIIIYHRSIMIYLDRHVIFAFLSTLRTVDHTWQTVDHDLPFIHFFSKIFSFSIRYCPWTVDRNLPPHQRWTIFNKRLNHIPDVSQAYVRFVYRDFIFLLTSFHSITFSPKRV